MEEYDKLDQLARDIEMPTEVYNKDGSVNYRNVLKVLTDKKYKEWRKDNKGQLRPIMADMGLDLTAKAINTGIDLAKIGFGAWQIKKGNKIKVEPPRFPDKPRKNQNLRAAMAMAARRASQGMSDEDRRLSILQGNQGFRDTIRNVGRLSGGQSSAAQAGVQIADYRRRLNDLKRIALSEQARQGNERAYQRLIGLDLQEDERRRIHDVQGFQMQKMPLFEQRLAERQDLLGAGVQNIAGAVDHLGQKITTGVEGFKSTPQGRFASPPPKEGQIPYVSRPGSIPSGQLSYSLSPPKPEPFKPPVAQNITMEDFSTDPSPRDINTVDSFINRNNIGYPLEQDVNQRLLQQRNYIE